MVYRWCARLSLSAMTMAAPLHAALAHGRMPQATRPYAVSTTSDGLTLTLTTRRSSYPRDALVPVTVTLRNRSNGNASIEKCAGFLPSVQMLDAGGHQVSQPTIPSGFVHPACFDPTVPVPFPVGQSVNWQGLIILRAPRLRAAETIYGARESFTGPGTNLQTPILRLHTLPAARTQAAIVTSPPLHAIVQAPAGAHIYYTDHVDCSNLYAAAIFGGSDGWTQADSHTIKPTKVDNCTHRTRWWVAIAIQGIAPIWLDHRIPLPSLPAGGSISAPRCRSAPPHGVGAVAATWHGAVYLVAANGARTCRLSGTIGAKGARLSPNGQWATWLAPDRARRWIDDLWFGRPDGAAAPRQVQGTTFGTDNPGPIWSPAGKLFAYGRGGSIFVVWPARGKQVRLAPYSTRLGPPLSWLPNGSAVAAQIFPSGSWAHKFDLALDGVRGQVRDAAVQFPTWLNNPNARPIGSRILSEALIGADGEHVFLITSGGNVRVSGIWEASVHPSPSGNPARLVIGSRARVRGRPAPAVHLDGATHMFDSPDGRYLVVDPRSGFWVEDTRTLQGHLVPVSSQSNCVISQSAWMGGGRAIAFVQTCRLAAGTPFRSTLWSVGLTGRAPRRLLSTIDYQLDAISIDTVYRCVGCGFNPGS